MQKKDSPNRCLVGRGSECDDGGEIMFQGINKVSECLQTCNEQPGCSVFSFWPESDENNRCRWEQSAYVGRCKKVKSEKLSNLYAIPQEACRCLKSWSFSSALPKQTFPSVGTCGQDQVGCTLDCTGQWQRSWCAVANPGCKQEQHTFGGGWTYCSEKPLCPPLDEGFGYGGDVAASPHSTPSAKACQVKCTEHARCHSFTFALNTNTCTMFERTQHMRVRAGASVSGLPCAVHANAVLTAATIGFSAGEDIAIAFRTIPGRATPEDYIGLYDTDRVNDNAPHIATKGKASGIVTLVGGLPPGRYNALYEMGDGSGPVGESLPFRVIADLDATTTTTTNSTTHATTLATTAIATNTDERAGSTPGVDCRQLLSLATLTDSEGKRFVCSDLPAAYCNGYYSPGDGTRPSRLCEWRGRCVLSETVCSRFVSTVAVTSTPERLTHGASLATTTVNLAEPRTTIAVAMTANATVAEEGDRQMTMWMVVLASGSVLVSVVLVSSAVASSEICCRNPKKRSANTSVESTLEQSSVPEDVCAESPYMGNKTVSRKLSFHDLNSAPPDDDDPYKCIDGELVTAE